MNVIVLYQSARHALHKQAFAAAKTGASAEMEYLVAAIDDIPEIAAVFGMHSFFGNAGNAIIAMELAI